MSKMVEMVGDMLEIRTPYNPGFVSALKTRISTRSWDGGKKAWIVPAVYLDSVNSLLRDFYGYTGEPTDEMVVVRVSCPNGADNRHGPVTFMGYSLASAWGRDSGARVGDNVALVEGNVTSGGSVKNWHSIVRAGSMFDITMPANLNIEGTPDFEVISITPVKKAQEPQGEVLPPSELDTLKVLVKNALAGLYGDDWATMPVSGMGSEFKELRDAVLR